MCIRDRLQTFLQSYVNRKTNSEQVLRIRYLKKSRSKSHSRQPQPRISIRTESQMCRSLKRLVIRSMMRLRRMMRSMVASTMTRKKRVRLITRKALEDYLTQAPRSSIRRPGLSNHRQQRLLLSNKPSPRLQVQGDEKSKSIIKSNTCFQG